MGAAADAAVGAVVDVAVVAAGAAALAAVVAAALAAAVAAVAGVALVRVAAHADASDPGRHCCALACVPGVDHPILLRRTWAALA